MRRRLDLLPLVVSALAVAGWTAGSAGATVPDPAEDPTRVSLARLRPSTSQAYGDLAPIYHDGCHIGRAGTTPHHCTYGKKDGYRVLAVLGDSIMGQWWAPIDAAARAEGWRVIWMTKTACPGIDVTKLDDDGKVYINCDRWRARAFAKIRGLSRVDMVLTGGSSRSIIVQRGTRKVLHGDARRRGWQRGAERTIDAVDGRARRVVLLRDTPFFRGNIPSCMAAHGGWTRQCSGSRGYALVAHTWEAEQAAAAEFDRARATELTDRICKPDSCWPVTSDLILRYRDRHHMTNTFAAALTPALRTRLRWLMR